MNNVVLSLFEATISLYPADAAGAPVLTSPVWIGACAEGLQIRDVWLKREFRPTGRLYPRQRPLVPQYEISIDRVWLVQLADRIGYVPTRGQYVMDILWREEEDGGWRREVYSGVTISERSRASKDLDAKDGAAFAEHQVFNAESVALSAGTGTPPALESGVVYRVQFQSSTEMLDLYSYSSSSENFTALASTSGRATITYVPSDRSGELRFAFGGAPVVVLDAAGSLTAEVFVAGPPTNADLPRLNFFAGAQRVASITSAGIVFATAFREVPSPSGNGFHLYGGSAVRAVMSLPELLAVEFIEQTSGSVTADTTASTADTTALTADNLT